MFYSDRLLLLSGSGEESAINVHNHWSCCRALTRPAVFSPRGQTSTPPHYRAASKEISTATTASPQCRHTHTQTTHNRDQRLSLCLKSQIFVFLLIMWLRGFGLYCDTGQQRAFSTHVWWRRSTCHAPSDDLWANFWLIWWVLSCLSYEHCLWWSQVKLRTTFKCLSAIITRLCCLSSTDCIISFFVVVHVLTYLRRFHLHIWFTFSFPLWCTTWSISCMLIYYVPLSDTFC